MNHFVPEFDMDDYSIPSSSGHHHHRQRNMQEDEILELLWQNGQVVVQSQHPRSLRKPSPPPPPPPPPQEQQKHHQLPAPPLPTPPDTQLFMQEDEMISWLEYPSFDRDLADLLYVPPGPPPPSSSAPLRPPLPPAPAPEVNFPQFSRTTTRFPESGPSTSSRNNEMRGSTTVVDSSDTPAVRQKLKIPMAVEISADRGNRWRETGGASVAGGGGNSISMSREIDTCDLTQTSSPGGSGASLSATATADPMTLQPADDRKGKGRQQADEVNADYSEDLEIESYEPKKQTRGAGNKRSRAAEVHNLSERRRRDRINEKMKVLQELIPRSSKTDKASMLDEAIDYLKSLQMQVQMMSMGCGMVPVMFPQQYMSSMGMGMGMGMGMEMGMNRPMMPFPGVLPGSAMPTPGAPSHLNPRFPLQAFQTPGDSSANPGHNMAMIPSLADAYQQQCMSMQQMPVQIPQNQLTRQPSISKQTANRGGKVHENHPTG